MFPDKDLEHQLLEKYKSGDIVNARVIPGRPSIAFLEVAPFSKLSAIAVPVVTLLYFAIAFGYGWVLVEAFEYKL